MALVWGNCQKCGCTAKVNYTGPGTYYCPKCGYSEYCRSSEAEMVALCGVYSCSKCGKKVITPGICPQCIINQANLYYGGHMHGH